jgi:glycosyltransferase involved in cell wall biosynthesis
MKLCLTLEHRFLQTPDGKIWTITQCPYEFYREYLQVFDSVQVISRAFPVERAEANFLPVEGPGVEFFAMPGYQGPYGFLRNFRKVRKRAQMAVPEKSAVIFRLPSQIANSVERHLMQRGSPYAIEVVADPYDVLSPAANRHPVAPIARQYFTRRLKRQCQQAVAVSYVTQSYLQRRYPPAARHDATAMSRNSAGITQFTTAVSDVNLSPDCFVIYPRTALRDPACIRIIFVGTLESLYKGPDTLLDAIAICKGQGIPVRVRLLGIGKQMEHLQKCSLRLGIEKQVEFVGSVSAGEAVRRELDRADLFVLPSRAEGVPRAMLEAMARGLPCLGSTVGGIPELLSKEDLVPPDNPVALAQSVRDVFDRKERIGQMSFRNLRKAHNYSVAAISQQRQEFFRAVKDLTARAHDEYKEGRHRSLTHPVMNS